MDTRASGPLLPAGAFAEWLDQTLAALKDGREAAVPCGGCTACCRSSQFVPVGPEETDALAHIPAEVVFPAPGRPGHVVLGYDEQGRCPMLAEDGCSIYAHRPRACRTYDCRVYAAAGVTVDDDKPALAERVGQWRFSFPARADEVRLGAVRAAASYLSAHAGGLDGFPERSPPGARAAMAIELHDLFQCGEADSGGPAVAEPDPQIVQVRLRRLTTDQRRRPGSSRDR